MRLGVEAALVEGALVAGDVEVADGALVAVGLSPPGRGYAIPGLVDLQVNGFGGVDFASADAAGYRRAGEALLETGVTAYQPTLITAPEADLVAALAEVPAGTAQPRIAAQPRILGVHLEGPFLAPERLGVHPASARVDPDPALLARLLDAGPVSHVTLAPELPGALELIELLRERRIVISCGHSNATAEEAARAFDRGVETVTHLFNAMRPFRHRDPGLAGAALSRPDVIVQMIVDGVHLADETVRLVLAAAGGRLALVSDAIAAAGLGDGRYRLGGVEVDVRAGVCRSPDGSLAGSAQPLIGGMRRLHALGAPLPDAVAAVTSVPARIARRTDVGVLRVGGPADLVRLDDALEPTAVLIAGEEPVPA